MNYKNVLDNNEHGGVTWTPMKIKIDTLREEIENKIIQIPAYQRGVVWTESMQKSLVDSLRKQYPFGSLTIYVYDKEKKLIIDGLQRCTALIKFIEDPAFFFEKSDISEETIEKIVNKLEEVGYNEEKKDKKKKQDSVRDTIYSFVKLQDTEEKFRKMETMECAQEILKNVLNIESEKFSVCGEIAKLIEPDFEKYKSLIQKIKEKEIPYIEIRGKGIDLAEIFNRINNRGMKLSKQNIFAATWANHSVKIEEDNEKLIETTIDRYNSIYKNGKVTIYGYDETEFREKGELDVFELTYALGKIIANKYPNLFEKRTIKVKGQDPKTDYTYVDMFPFSLINACLLEQNSNVSRMNEKLVETFNTDKDINLFIKKILDCVDYVNNLLKGITRFKLNKRGGEYVLPHADFQIISIIASLFRLRHVEVHDNKKYKYKLDDYTPEWKKVEGDFKKNIVKRYILDILSSEWGSHGDSTMDKIVRENYMTYTRIVKEEDFIDAVNSTYKKRKNDRLEKDVDSVASPDKIDYVLLCALYSSTMLANEYENNNFDIEHLATKKIMERKLSKYEDLKLPISSIGNICLLTEYNNRKKKDKLIYDDDVYLDSYKGRFSDAECDREKKIKQLEKLYTFTNKEDFDWIHEEIETAEKLKYDYFRYIDRRFYKMLRIIVNHVFNKSYTDNEIIKKCISKYICINVNNKELIYALNDNYSAEEFYRFMKDKKDIIEAHEYGNFEKKSSITDDQNKIMCEDRMQTAFSGELVMSEGKDLSLIYRENTYEYTKVGHIVNLNDSELKDVLGNGDITYTIKCE